jgi:hypothetical protein
MQLLQKPTATLHKNKHRLKIVAYIALFTLCLSCKPFLYRQGIGLVFDYEVAIGRIQHTANFIAYQLAPSSSKPTVVYKKGDAK